MGGLSVPEIPTAAAFYSYERATRRSRAVDPLVNNTNQHSDLFPKEMNFSEREKFE